MPGRPRPARPVGSALLLKGLEAGVCVVLDAEVVDTAHLYVAMTRVQAARRLVTLPITERVRPGGAWAGRPALVRRPTSLDAAVGRVFDPGRPEGMLIQNKVAVQKPTQRRPMLRDRFPGLFDATGKLAYGLQPVEVLPSGRFMLVVKVTKEMILTARLNGKLTIYLAVAGAGRGCPAGLVTAFFDDHDEPMVVVTPMFSNDALLHDLTGVLSQQAFDLHFIDEFDREAMSVRAINRDAPRFRERIRRIGFPDFCMETAAAAGDMLHGWFGTRGPSDDANAFTVNFEEYSGLDTGLEPGAARCGPGASDAEPPQQARIPGAEQERDIAALLRRAFPEGEVVLNPMRDDTGKELTDILVVTDDLVFLVQAKDSPNSRASLDRSLDRKRSVAKMHVEKAARQLRGALRHVTSNETVGLRAAGRPLSVQVGGRALRGLVVVQELFEPDIVACSAAVLGVAEEQGAPCVLLAFGKLHEMALHLPSPARLLAGLDSLYRVAVETGSYPAPRFLQEPGPESPPESA